MRTKMEYKTKPRITDEELQPYDDLFEGAKKELENKDAVKVEVVRKLADKLKEAGYTETKICGAIVKKLNVINIDTGKVYANKDYIMRKLPSSMKDYIHGKKGESKTKPRVKKLEPVIMPKPKARDIDFEREKLKPVPTPINEKRKSQIDATIQKAIEIGKAHGYDIADAEIEIIDTETVTDTVVDVPAQFQGPTLKEKAQEMQQQLNDLQSKLQIALLKVDDAQNNFNRKSAEFDALESDYKKLLDEHNAIIKPFMERQWITVNTLNADGEKVPNIVEFDIVAYPVRRRILIPVDTPKRNYKRHVTPQEKVQHEEDWKKFTKGNMSADVSVKPKSEAQE